MIAGGQVTLFVKDVARAVRFYVETLGVKLVEDGGKGYAVLDAGDGFRIALHGPTRARGRARSGGAAKPTKGTPKVGLYPKMPIQQAIAILENRGVELEVQSDAELTLATFRDPDGNVLYLRQATQAK
jgi:catechol 2,3-dioxygenase-like lactoylglutathione lyase family enzyme